MKRKILTKPEPVVPADLLEQAKKSASPDRLKKVEKSSLCGAETTVVAAGEPLCVGGSRVSGRCGWGYRFDLVWRCGGRGIICRRVGRGSAALLAPQVVLVVAGVHMDPAVLHLHQAGSQFVDEIAVVRNEDDGAVVLLQRGQQDVLGAHVQAIGGLVEQHEVRWPLQHAAQRMS